MRKKRIEIEDPEYWNRLLVKHGLSVERGRNRRIIYVGSSSDLTVIEGAERARKEYGQVAAKDSME